jgi:hypothetical protein
VKRNNQAADVDGQSLDDFSKVLKFILIKRWKQMASGSDLLPVVWRVEIPKSGEGIRPLSIPRVAVRIAQMEMELSYQRGQLTPWSKTVGTCDKLLPVAATAVSTLVGIKPQPITGGRFGGIAGAAADPLPKVSRFDSQSGELSTC